MYPTSYILVVQGSIPFTQNIVVSDADRTSEGIDMDALGPNRSIQRMAVTDVLEKTTQQGEELEVQSSCFAHLLQVSRGTHKRKVTLDYHLGNASAKGRLDRLDVLHSHSPSGPEVESGRRPQG